MWTRSCYIRRNKSKHCLTVINECFLETSIEVNDLEPIARRTFLLFTWFGVPTLISMTSSGVNWKMVIRAVCIWFLYCTTALIPPRTLVSRTQIVEEQATKIFLLINSSFSIHFLSRCRCCSHPARSTVLWQKVLMEWHCLHCLHCLHCPHCLDSSNLPTFASWPSSVGFCSSGIQSRFATCRSSLYLLPH